MISTNFFTAFLCLLASPLRYPNSSVPVDVCTQCWLDAVEATAWFVRSVHPDPTPNTPSRPPIELQKLLP
jgi:hypothetical protein